MKYAFISGYNPKQYYNVFKLVKIKKSKYEAFIFFNSSYAVLCIFSSI